MAQPRPNTGTLSPDLPAPGQGQTCHLRFPPLLSGTVTQEGFADRHCRDWALPVQLVVVKDPEARYAPVGQTPRQVVVGKVARQSASVVWGRGWMGINAQLQFFCCISF